MTDNEYFVFALDPRKSPWKRAGVCTLESRGGENSLMLHGHY